MQGKDRHGQKRAGVPRVRCGKQQRMGSPRERSVHPVLVRPDARLDEGTRNGGGRSDPRHLDGGRVGCT